MLLNTKCAVPQKLNVRERACMFCFFALVGGGRVKRPCRWQTAAHMQMLCCEIDFDTLATGMSDIDKVQEGSKSLEIDIARCICTFLARASREGNLQRALQLKVRDYSELALLTGGASLCQRLVE